MSVSVTGVSGGWVGSGRTADPSTGGAPSTAALRVRQAALTALWNAAVERLGATPKGDAHVGERVEWRLIIDAIRAEFKSMNRAIKQRLAQAENGWGSACECPASGVAKTHAARAQCSRVAGGASNLRAPHCVTEPAAGAVSHA
ncbi:MAG: hypothetical protein Q8L45_01560 [Xanthomonadaceae bacterium]|nr:hypothetical protein [Xanthomonadaceae bacterium]MDP2185053.1 hypothetical protein [Xanthomonadales bacterium]MDZ4114432.1 hypothetical protein [Xanthomonadaceae bacterium]